ncbi:MAG: serine/threonine protein kinase [Verrucomicrobiales bacterium]|jgi:serine/threonine-protein kinase|nr:serine/threonine protein kinase [Verrucomicrobiales bacterium]
MRIGELIGNRYKIQSFIGKGGMQEVYKAYDTIFERYVVLKEPIAPSAEKRFFSTAQLSAKIVHPNIALTLDYIPNDKHDYLVEEFIDGTDLEARLHEEFHYLDPHLTAWVFHSLAKGLAASHKLNINHRDLKPKNIMVSSDPGIKEIKITDFGIAKMAAAVIDDAVEGGEDTMVASSTVIGALAYMAPEIIDQKLAEHRGLPSDIWSLGAVVYRLMSGVPPFGEGLAAVHQILSQKLPSKESFVRGNIQFRALEEELWTIVSKCLAFDVHLRPSAEDLANELSMLCYTKQPRYRGRVYNYRAFTGSFGFLSRDNDEDVFLHGQNSYVRSVSNGQYHNFACYPGTPRNRAFPSVCIKTPLAQS